MSDYPRLSVRNVGKTFGAHRALSDVHIDVARGEVLGLVGENGAGKSTLLNIVSGVFPPTSGELLLDDVVVHPHSYQDANRLGIFRVFQDTALIDGLSVAENLFFGWESLHRGRGRIIDRTALERDAEESLELAGIHGIDVRKPVSGLSAGVRQGLDIARATTLARALDIESPIVLFDEPTTALDSTHEENFLRLLEQLEGWASVVFVSHRLPEILRSTNRTVVLKDGRVTGQRITSETDEAELHSLMVGRVRTANYYRQDAQQTTAPDAAPLLSVRGLSVAPFVSDVSLDLAPGEILGLAGTDGSGTREIGASIAGALARDSGTVELDGTEVAASSIEDAVRLGLVYVPADRTSKGLITSFSVVDNLQLPSLRDRFGTRFGIWRRAAAREHARTTVEELGIVTRSIDTPISALSGGNQQKVLIAKWLGRNPSAVVLDNPTQGVDTGSREGIYDIVRRVAAAGTAVLLISDDLSELIGLSDRIAIVVDGRIADVVLSPPGDKPSEEAIVSSMIPTGTPSPALNGIPA